MKLIVVGASGFVATEVLRQSLENPKITAVVALARSSVSPPSGLSPDADKSKLQSVVIEDYSVYTEEAKKALTGADACIWTVAITPPKARGLPSEKVRLVNHDYTITGIHAILEANSSRTGVSPFRFLYMSGHGAERDPSKKPRFFAEYLLQRGETENEVLKFAADRKGQIEVTVVKPGMITRTGDVLGGMMATAFKWAGIVPYVTVRDLSAAMLQQVLDGFEKEPLDNEDLVRIGKAVLNARNTA